MNPRDRLDDRLGAVRHREAAAGPASLDHGDVIRTVADDDRVFQKKLAVCAAAQQRFELGFLAQNRIDQRAGEFAVFDFESVGLVFLKTNAARDGLRERLEPA